MSLTARLAVGVREAGLAGGGAGGRRGGCRPSGPAGLRLSSLQSGPQSLTISLASPDKVFLRLGATGFAAAAAASQLSRQQGRQQNQLEEKEIIMNFSKNKLKNF